jgi:hypothetical protein
MSDRPIIFRLRGSSWVLPGLPWVFGALYLILSVVEEPFRPDLLIAGLIALAFGFLCLVSNLTSRVIVSSERLDVRDYGVRHVLASSDVSCVYTIPSTFSTIIAFDGAHLGKVTIHLGYWRDEAAMLQELSHIVRINSITASPKAAKLLGVAPSTTQDATSPSLVEGFLALSWVLASTVLPVLLGLVLA